MGGRPRIALVTTGGTIDAIGKDRLDLADYGRHGRALSATDLLAMAPEIGDIAEVLPVPLPRFGACSMSVDDWLLLHEAITRAAGGVEGVVVTQGTNYIEETAYFLTLSLKTACAVVVTGAMRPASGISTDGPINLLSSVRVAATPEAAEHGVTVVLNEQIHAARDVTKTLTHGIEAFKSPNHGPLGMIGADGGVTFYRRSLRSHTVQTPFEVADIAAGALPRVDIISSYYGADGQLIDAAVRSGAKGLVSVGFGAGRAGPGLTDAFDKAIAQGVVIAQSARPAGGQVLASELLAARGVVAAGDLPPWKARILLMLALVGTSNPREIQDMFLKY